MREFQEFSRLLDRQTAEVAQFNNLTFTRVLRGLPGVGSVVVALEPGTAQVTYDAQRTGLPALKRAVEDAGYEVAS